LAVLDLESLTPPAPDDPIDWGMTDTQQARLLEAAEGASSLQEACRAVGYSYRRLKQRAKDDPGFRALLNAARDCYLDELESACEQRALHGYQEADEEIEQNADGVQVRKVTRTRHRYDNHLAFRMLAARRPLYAGNGEASEEDGSAGIKIILPQTQIHLIATRPRSDPPQDASE
jgi:hypothetical protein